MDKSTISIKGKLTADTPSNTVILPSLETNKVYIWGYELCKGSDWNAFLEVVNKLGKENQQLQKQLEENNRISKEAYRYLRREYDKRIEENKQAHILNDRLGEKIKGLENQLKSQPAEIVENINGEIYTRMVVECKETKYTDINLILNTILKEYQK